MDPPLDLRKNDNEAPNKRQKLKSDSSQSQYDESSYIFKLNIDCFDELLDYLSTNDLLALGRTCKTLQQVVGEYMKENCSAATKIDRDIVYNRELISKNSALESTGFNQFTKYIHQDRPDSQPMKYIESHSDEFTSVNHLYAQMKELKPQTINRIKNILSQLEVLQLHYVQVPYDFYERFLRHCVNLKRFSISDSNHGNTVTMKSNNWLHENYPSLEHLELTIRYPLKIDVNELTTFFQLNPNVHSFSTSYIFLSENRIGFMNSGIKVDVLQVKKQDLSMYRVGDVNVNEMFDLFKELHICGFYKHLHLYMQRISQQFVEQIILLGDVLEKLCFRNYYDTGHCDTVFTNWPILPKLKDLGIVGVIRSYETEILAQRLVNIKRVYLHSTTYADISTFVRHSAKLKQIFVKDVIPLNANIPKITTLNNQREKLKDARKVTIYFPDNLFVANKWIAPHGNLNLNLVEIKRSDSYRWDHYYNCFF